MRHHLRFSQASVGFIALAAAGLLASVLVGCPPVPGRASVPDLRGMTEAEAQGALEEAGLTLGAVNYEHDDDAKEGLVFRQGTKAGTWVTRGSVVDVTVSRGPSFFEEYPAWNIPDPALLGLEAAPGRASPGEAVELRAMVGNVGTGACEAGEVRFEVDGAHVGTVPVDGQVARGSTEVSLSWTADAPGRHVVRAELAPPAIGVDPRIGNSSRTATVWVSGGDVQEPYLELAIGFDPLQLVEGAPAEVLLSVRNPSFADVVDLPWRCYIDNAQASNGVLARVGANEAEQLRVPWGHVTPGEHLVVAELDLPDGFPYPVDKLVRGWTAIVPDISNHYSVFQPHHWLCIGPTILTNNWNGRLNSIVCHPSNKKVLYGGAPAGVFRSTDGGNSWKSMLDKMPRNDVGDVNVDPQNGQTVYATTGSFAARTWEADAPILKSIDGGVKWHQFATGIAEGARRIIVRRTSTGGILVYAGTSRGVYRYTSANPAATTSAVADWDLILPGVVRDLAVHPTDNKLVYASMDKWVVVNNKSVLLYDDLFRTKKGDTAAGIGDWLRLRVGLPAIQNTTGTSVVIDIYKQNPQILYACVRVPGPYKVGGVDVYRSANGGDSWKLQFGRRDQDKHDVSYNPFIKVHPSTETVYYGGIKTYKEERDGSGNWKSYEVTGTHADLKDFTFDPHVANGYYVTNDGGIWYGTMAAGANETPIHRNNDLRSFLFWDFDVAMSKTDLLIGGSQDNGTVRYDGSTVWKMVRDGDGMYAVIASSNHNVMYSQHQFLSETQRSPDGGASWIWKGVNTGLSTSQKWGFYDAFITVHPNDPKTIMAQGDEVVESTDGGWIWSDIGPKLSGNNHYVRRIVVQPVTFTRMVGTSKGQIWYRAASQWHLARSHPKNARVDRMVFAPSNHKILYVAYDSWDKYYRIERLEQIAGGGWVGTWITDNLPVKYAPSGQDVRVTGLAADGHRDSVVYVGTNKGVYRWREGELTYKSWQPYNDGFPLVEVRDLLVGPGPGYRLYAATWGRAAWAVITGP